jgi:membrane protease YdiL (CAAX protease family)
VGSILDTLEQHPAVLATLPLSTFAVVGATLIFTAGHQAYEYLSAVLYFLFTTWLYKKTGSLWACILIHGLTNLAIALMVRYAGMGWLWG